MFLTTRAPAPTDASEPASSLTLLPLLSLSVLIVILLFFAIRLFKRTFHLPHWNWLRGKGQGRLGLSGVELLPTSIKAIPTPSPSPYAASFTLGSNVGLKDTDTALLSRSSSLEALTTPAQSQSPRRSRARTPFKLPALFHSKSRGSSKSPVHRRSKSLSVPIRHLSRSSSSSAPPTPSPQSQALLIDFSSSSGSSTSSDLGTHRVSPASPPLIPGLPIPSPSKSSKNPLLLPTSSSSHIWAFDLEVDDSHGSESTDPLLAAFKGSRSPSPMPIPASTSKPLIQYESSDTLPAPTTNTTPRTSTFPSMPFAPLTAKNLHNPFIPPSESIELASLPPKNPPLQLHPTHTLLSPPASPPPKPVLPDPNPNTAPPSLDAKLVDFDTDAEPSVADVRDGGDTRLDGDSTRVVRLDDDPSPLNDDVAYTAAQELEDPFADPHTPIEPLISISISAPPSPATSTPLDLEGSGAWHWDDAWSAGPGAGAGEIVGVGVELGAGVGVDGVGVDVGGGVELSAGVGVDEAVVVVVHEAALEVSDEVQDAGITVVDASIDAEGDTGVSRDLIEAADAADVNAEEHIAEVTSQPILAIEAILEPTMAVKISTPNTPEPITIPPPNPPPSHSHLTPDLPLIHFSASPSPTPLSMRVLGGSPSPSPVSIPLGGLNGDIDIDIVDAEDTWFAEEPTFVWGELDAGSGGVEEEEEEELLMKVPRVGVEAGWMKMIEDPPLVEVYIPEDMHMHTTSKEHEDQEYDDGKHISPILIPTPTPNNENNDIHDLHDFNSSTSTHIPNPPPLITITTTTDFPDPPLPSLSPLFPSSKPTTATDEVHLPSQTPTPPASPPLSPVRTLASSPAPSFLTLSSPVPSSPVLSSPVSSSSESSPTSSQTLDTTTPSSTTTPNRPLWSLRASDAPALGLATNNTGASMKPRSSPVPPPSAVLEPIMPNEELVKDKNNKEDEEGEKEDSKPAPLVEIVPVTLSTSFPGSFPSPQLSTIALPPSTSTPTSIPAPPAPAHLSIIPRTVPSSSSSPSSSPSSSSSSTTTTTATKPTPTPTAQKPTSTTLTPLIPLTNPLQGIRRPRSALDIALAMQLRPGLGVGADPAWMVRFLMSMFGWFALLISGAGEV
ncbi:hypothetical protein Hypma_001539 [Hypsizygus marmoreus]|uniref:Uncharacterized protein n=1 Tax=Hypsizygus marmoreus TaxID=39966 RepID=A0A369K677_HYPMA|nr:hypothetical protein Hypma_001539 [Hypsizygus marmoreus]